MERQHERRARLHHPTRELEWIVVGIRRRIVAATRFRQSLAHQRLLEGTPLYPSWRSQTIGPFPRLGRGMSHFFDNLERRCCPSAGVWGG
jgi:hypothetical protein